MEFNNEPTEEQLAAIERQKLRAKVAERKEHDSADDDKAAVARKRSRIIEAEGDKQSPSNHGSYRR